MPLNLQLLCQGDLAEWNRAVEQLELRSVALRVVRANMGGRFPHDVEDVAHTAILKLIRRVTRSGIDREAGIARLLNKIAHDESISFLTNWWVSRRREYDLNQLRQMEFVPREQDDITNFLDAVARHLQLRDIEQPEVAEWIANSAGLSPRERAILMGLRPIGTMTQARFAAKYDFAPQSIGRRKADMMKKLRKWSRGLGF